MNAENTASEVAQTILNSDKAAYIVAGSTAATGIIGNMADVQGWLSIGATSIGIILTFILVIKHGIDVIKAWKDLNK